MRRKISGVLLALLLVVPLFSAQVFAVEGSEDETQEVTTQSSDEDKTIKEAEKEATRQARLEEYKKEKEAKLQEWQEKRIAQRCENAQEKLEKLQTRFSNTVTNRTAAYQKVVSKVEILIAKLQAANVDTTEIEAALTELKAKADILVTSLNDYYTVLGDLVALKCSDDPEAFKSALEVAREYRETLHDNAKDFREYATGELKEILQALKAQLTTTDDSTTESSEVEED